MVPKVNPEKAAKYAIAASKGFSYYLPKSAQQHLHELLKLLPSTARPIYNEYYRDLMCAKACAPDSAVALTKFIRSFPQVARQHNAFAREMNREIDSNEHEGYNPAKFPIVAESQEQQAVITTVTNGGKKRKRSPAGFASQPDQVGKSQKKAVTESDVITVTILGSVNRPRSSSVSELPATSLSKAAFAEDAYRITPDLVGSADDLEDWNTDNRQVDRSSRSSSSTLDVLPSARVGDKGFLPAESIMCSETIVNSDPPRGDTSKLLADDHEDDNGSMPTPAAPPLRKLSANTVKVTSSAIPETVPRTTLESKPVSLSPHILAEITSLGEDPEPEERKETAEDVEMSLNNALSEAESESDYELVSENGRWEHGMQALSDFDWERKGSRWLNGRGSVSIHYEDPGESAGLFRSNHWDDSDAGEFMLGRTQPDVLED